ncbi:Filamin-A [Fasciola gigantica]|uniref:Filamin-A n=1 Tax=Fasciola gigantica TaxID=46835 RepID=A0A504YKH3_FASGI|nr:Filamin-A [Fasciola gigantica]
MMDTVAPPDIHVVEAGYVDSEDEVPMAEKDLAEDAQWKLIQKNTFTRWVNEHLKKANTHIDDLETDFSDGLRLIALIEVLTKQKFRHINKRPTFRTQKLENVTTALNYLEEVEGLRLVSIDSSHIVDCNLKLILGLIWTLIMHYSISLPMWEGEDERPQEEVTGGPKQRLLGWIKQKIPDASIRNFTTDWNSGVAIGALVDACAPGLCPDWPDWDTRQSLRNATEAMTTAEEWLSVPQLIRPEEMVNPNVDEKAMMTYISQFPSAKLREGAPLRPRQNPSNVRVYGPGIEATGNTLGNPCSFVVETASAGRGQLEVIILNPKGAREPCNVVARTDPAASFSCVYEPRMDGEHRVIIKFAGQEVPLSPFRVNIEGPAADPSKVIVSGPGIDRLAKNCVGRRAHFTVNAQNAGKGVVECVIVDPAGRRDTVKPRVSRPDGNAIYLVEYTPKDPGTHQILVYFAGQQIPTSPFPISVTPPFNPEMVYATGRGVQARGIRAQDEVTFRVHTERAGDQAPVKATMVRSDGTTEPVQVEQTDEHLWTCSYTPQRPGKYSLRVLYGNGDIQNSPFNIIIGPHKKCGITAFGPGLIAGVVNHPNIFTVCCREESSKIGFSIEGPSEARMDCFNNGDGTARVTYTVGQPGEYAVHILYEDEDIPNSPYMPMIHPSTGDIHPDRVRVYGPGVEKSKTSLVIGKPVEFFVEGLADAVPPSIYRTITDANLDSILRAECHDAMGNPVPMRVYRRSDGTIVFMYTPTATGVHTISATVAHVPIQGAPFRVNVAADVQPEKVKVYGPGLNDAVFNEATHFIIDPREAFPGEQDADAVRTHPVTVRAIDSQGRTIPVKLNKLADGTYRVEYTPDPGMNEVTFTPMLGGVPTCKTPLRVPVRPPFDPRRIKIVDLNSTIPVGSIQTFRLIPEQELKPQESLSVDFRSLLDTGLLVAETIQKKGVEYWVTFCPAVVGKYQVAVHLNNHSVAEPYLFDVVPQILSSILNGHVDQVLSDSPQTEEEYTVLDGFNAPETIFMVRTQISIQVTKTGLTIGNIVPNGTRLINCCGRHGCGTPPPAEPSTHPVSDLSSVGTSSVTSIPRSPEPESTRLFHLRVQTVSRVESSIASTELLSLYPVQEEPEADGTEVRGLVTQSVSPKESAEAVLNSGNSKPNHDPSELSLGVHPSRPYITEKEKAVLIAKSRWPQCSPDQDAAKVHAEGPGLIQALVTQTATFTIDSRDAPGAPLGVTVTGQGEATLECVDNGDGTCSVTYKPTQPGRYTLNVVYNGEAHIPGSPFFIQAFPLDRLGLRTDLCRTYGLGVESTGVFKASYVKFIVNASAIDPTGQGAVSAILCAPDNERLTCQVKNNHDGTYTCSYTPLEEGERVSSC